MPFSEDILWTLRADVADLEGGITAAEAEIEKLENRLQESGLAGTEAGEKISAGLEASKESAAALRQELDEISSSSGLAELQTGVESASESLGGLASESDQAATAVGALGSALPFDAIERFADRTLRAKLGVAGLGKEAVSVVRSIGVLRLGVAGLAVAIQNLDNILEAAVKAFVKGQPEAEAYAEAVAKIREQYKLLFEPIKTVTQALAEAFPHWREFAQAVGLIPLHELSEEAKELEARVASLRESIGGSSEDIQETAQALQIVALELQATGELTGANAVALDKAIADLIARAAEAGEKVPDRLLAVAEGVGRAADEARRATGALTEGQEEQAEAAENAADANEDLAEVLSEDLTKGAGEAEKALSELRKEAEATGREIRDVTSDTARSLRELAEERANAATGTDGQDQGEDAEREAERARARVEAIEAEIEALNERAILTQEDIIRQQELELELAEAKAATRELDQQYFETSQEQQEQILANQQAQVEGQQLVRDTIEEAKAKVEEFAAQFPALGTAALEPTRQIISNFQDAASQVGVTAEEVDEFGRRVDESLQRAVGVAERLGGGFQGVGQAGKEAAKGAGELAAKADDVSKAIGPQGLAGDAGTLSDRLSDVATSGGRAADSIEDLIGQDLTQLRTDSSDVASTWNQIEGSLARSVDHARELVRIISG